MLFEFVSIYILIINLLSVLSCIIDKRNSKRDRWRISEKNLLLMCVMGGSVAMYITMRIIRHKTRHNKFMIGIPLIFALQLIAVIAVMYLI